MSVRFRQKFNSEYGIRFLKNGKSVYYFRFLFLSNLEKRIFLDLLLPRKREKDLGFSTTDPLRLINHIHPFCCTHY